MRKSREVLTLTRVLLVDQVEDDEETIKEQKMSEKNYPITAFPAFIDVTEDAQMTELEEYLEKRGVHVEVSDKTKPQSRVRSIVGSCGNVFSNADIQAQELEGLLFCVASLLHLIEVDTAVVLREMCQLVTTGANQDNAAHRLRMFVDYFVFQLGLLFCQFEARDPLAFVVLQQEIKFAEEFDIGHHLNVTLPALKKWMDNWKLSADDRRDVLILFWNAIKSFSDHSLRTDTLIEILSTSTSTSKDGEFANELIVLALNDPSNYFFNTILQLEAVKNLQSQESKLFKIFVEGRLSSFTCFCESNRAFIDQLGLEYSICEKKMQLLTLVSLAVESKEVSFATLERELQLQLGDIEQLIIDAIRQKLLKARIDHVNKKLIVMSCVHRTFDREQWQLIHDRLSSWKDNISALRANLRTLHEMPA